MKDSIKSHWDVCRGEGPRKALMKPSAVFHNPWAAQRVDTSFYRARQIQKAASSNPKTSTERNYNFD